jgi:hypothetical protein
MSNPDHISECLETIFFGLKYLNSLMRIRDRGPGRKEFGSGIQDGKNLDPGSEMEKIRSRDKHPGSATLKRDKDKRIVQKTALLKKKELLPESLAISCA